MLLVERLSDARRLGHSVLAVVRGSAVNSDGASNGLTAPNGPSQQRVIRQALADARLSPSDVDVVEAHGTGTRLGDPIEAQAILATYGQDRFADRPLWLGSVKSNIGHTQAAAGIAGVIKMVLAMRHGELPPTLHVDEPSPHVDWSAGHVQLLTEKVGWPETDRPRRAGVSSFGISGTNAHVVIEEPPGDDAVDGESGPARSEGAVVPWVLSAMSEAALREQAARLGSFVDGSPELGVVDVGYSLVTSRAVLEQRAVLVGRDRQDFLDGLSGLADGGDAAGLVRGIPGTGSKVVFVFPGQGSQWSGMAEELLVSSPVFAASAEATDEVLAEFLDWSVLDVLRAAPGAQHSAGHPHPVGEAVRDEPRTTPPPSLDRVDVVQPVLFTVMVGLAELWRSCGVEPAAVVGHSQGEIAAAYVAGGLTLRDAARVVACRSRAWLTLAGQGGMASVSLPAGQVEARLRRWGDSLSVAAINGPGTVAVSGDPAALDELVADLVADGVQARRIPGIDTAGHSAQVDCLREYLLGALAPISPCSSRIPFYSTVTGSLVDTAQLDAAYWYRNMRESVLFGPAVRGLVEQGHSVFVDVSPHPVLTVSVRETLDDMGSDGVAVGSLRRDEGGLDRFLTSLAEAYVCGVPVNWKTMFVGTGARRVDLPTYAFQRQRYWLETPTPSRIADSANTSAHAVETQFWEAVEHEDLEALATALELNGADRPSSLNAIRPALPLLSVIAGRRQRQREHSIVDSLRYRIAWRPLVQTMTPSMTPRLSGTWLVLVPRGNADTVFLRTLPCGAPAPGPRTRDKLVHAIVEAVGRHGAHTVTIEVEDGTDRGELGASLRAHDSPVSGVLSLLALADHAHPQHAAVPAGLALTLTLIQALGDVGIEDPLWCATHRAMITTPSEQMGNPAQAMIWGLGSVARQAHPLRWGGMLDLPETLDEPAAARLCGVLSGALGEDEVALRASGIFARRLVRAPLGQTTPVRQWTPRGTVLVTGGTGALGAHVARWLARHGAEHLLLTSLRGPDAPGAAELTAELTELGAKVSVVAADLAEQDALAEVLARVPREYPLTAVMHTAAMLDDALIDTLTLEQMDRVLRVKAKSALNLHELTRGMDLSAFVLFSSFAGTSGDLGQANYAPGNSLLDALAYYRRQQGLPATSVGWGHWAGGGIGEGVVEPRLLYHGATSIRPELAITALQRVLDHDETFVLVADVDWSRFGEITAATRVSRLLVDLPEVRAAVDNAGNASTGAGVTGTASLLERLAGASEPERDRLLFDLVCTHVAAVLGHVSPAEVQPRRAFRDVGFDSVTAVELRNRLGAATGLRLPATLVFDYSTPAVLANYLREELVGRDVATAAPVLAELDRLEATLAAMVPDEDARATVVPRLRSLLSRWSETPGGADIVVDDEIESATADELFDLIQGEFGKS